MRHTIKEVRNAGSGLGRFLESPAVLGLNPSVGIVVVRGVGGVGPVFLEEVAALIAELLEELEFRVQLARRREAAFREGGLHGASRRCGWGQVAEVRMVKNIRVFRHTSDACRRLVDKREMR